MSRQRGRRERPLSDRLLASRAETTAGARSRRMRPSIETPITPSRKWAAVAAGTLVVTFAFGAIATAIVEADDGNQTPAVVATVIALVLTPIVFGVVAFVSRHPSPWRVMMLSGPLAVFLFVGLSFLLREPVSPVVAAFGAGGILALRSERGIHSPLWRGGAVVIVTAYTFALFQMNGGLATIMAPFLPLPILAVADSVTERRFRDREGA